MFKIHSLGFSTIDFQSRKEQFEQSEMRDEQSCFPVIHEVDNIDIFVQLLMERNWQPLRTESISKQISIYPGALNSC